MEKDRKKLDAWQAVRADTEPHEEGRNNHQKKRNPSEVSVAIGSMWSPLPAYRQAGETLKLRIMRVRGIGGGAEWTVLRKSAPWLTIEMCRFKFSMERPPRSC